MSGTNNQEIEFRYLLKHMPAFHVSIERSNIIQGYLQRTLERTHRIRIETLSNGMKKAFDTVKGPKIGASGSEVEKEIPVDDAIRLLEQCEGDFVEKDRYKVPAENGLTWEVDEFKGKLTGLFIAEIELPSEDTPYKIPHWLVGVDITTDRRFANAKLVDVEPDELKSYIQSVLTP